MQPLNILHVLRAPVGGLFRHVCDLARGQIARGHRIGIIADRRSGGERGEQILRELEPALVLGLSRFPMHRQPHPADLFALRHVMRRTGTTGADVVHGHGAKGGVYARLAVNAGRAVRAYTPHGGSLLYSRDTLAGRFYLTTERLLMLRGDLFLFESGYSADMFRRKIGEPRSIVRIVYNGVTPAEFEPVAPAPGASDLLFLGELRMLKGVDLMLDALAALKREGRTVTATLVGDGPDGETFRAQVARLGLDDVVRLRPAMPTRQAQALGRIMVVPSRAESLPYVVLEAAASGKPLIVTRVGGIPEIYGPLSDRLVAPDDAAVLAGAIRAALDHPNAAETTAAKLRARVAASFTCDGMVEGVLEGYRDALSLLQKGGRR